MTNPPDRVWVVMDRDGFPRTVNDAAVDAKRDEDDLNQFNRSPRFGGPYTTHEYRLQRPILWRTGVPDAETVARCSNSFAVLIPNGTVLRFAERKHQHWYWHSTPAFRGGGLSLHNAVSGWCPEDEMPKGGA